MPTTATARTPAELLAALVASDPTRPRVTWYDDADGPTRGERIELSARVLANWTAKAANLLVDELDVEPGDVVVLALPTHWRALYWALAAWSAGAVVVVPTSVTTGVPTGDPNGLPADAEDLPPGARVLVVSAGTAWLADGADVQSVVAVSLAALSRRWDEGPLPTGAVDEAAVLTGQGDVFVPFFDPDPDASALRVGPKEWTAAGLVSAAREAASDLEPRARVLVTDGPGAAARLLAPWTVDGSLVLVRDPDPDAMAARLEAEQVTAR
ncbi:MAG TPA: TIGR03089 family protein [Actinomycetales bacterium]|nr:TIGR03089 family protein [Actinomycetales bacterium]